MFSSNKLAANKTCREIGREIKKRLIGRTSSAPNSDAVSRHDKRGMNSFEIKKSAQFSDNASHKWSTLSRHNNLRALSTIQTKANPSAVSAPVFSKEESREFMAIFPDIVRDLTDAGRHTDIPEVTKRFAKVLQYNVPTGKKTRGLSTVIAYKMLEKPENLTPENVRLAGILGWCVELLRSFALIADDILDDAEIRRNALCWHRNEGVGNSAMLDLVVLENGVYSVLRKYFSEHRSYVPIVELFHDVTAKAAMGKSLEGMLRGRGGAPDLGRFTMKNYDLVVKYRSGYFSFQLPVEVGMWLAGLHDPELHRQADTILFELGRFFKIKKDFLNCFGTSEVDDKIGSDINEGKCSWLAVVALQRASERQRRLMERYYGKAGDEAVEKVRDFYAQLGLPATFAGYEEETYKIITTHVRQISNGLPHELFYGLLNKTYQLQASLLIMDDLMDSSETRRGQPCWYKQENVGLLALNDSLHVETSLYSILKKYFSHLPCYVPIMELFHDVNFKTNMGQSLDALCMKDGRPILSQFTMKRYSSIVKYKTSYYTFQLPVSLGMYLADMYDPEQHRQAKTILMEIGEFFQIQDDFLDAFGDPEVTGKVGTDIKEGKCSWLAVVALQRASPAQRRVMEEHYGRPDPESTRIVKTLYAELGLPATFAVYEEESFNIIRTHIHQISKGLPHDLFFKIMKKIYKRDS